MLYKDRREAGAKVASRLMHYKDRADVIVLALPRGGVVNGHEIARRLNVTLDIIIVRKIGFPGQPELAIGAVSETGAVVLNEEMISSYGIGQDYINREVKRHKEEISRRKALYRAGRGVPPLRGKTVILVDDGVATGATMKAAISTMREDNPARLVAALPVASREAEAEIKGMVDEWVCLATPREFMAIGNFYEDFSQVSDQEVVDILKGSQTLYPGS